MNEEYLNSIYSQNGGSATFGSYSKFTELMLNNENYRKDVFNQLGGSQKFGGYDEYSSSLKKKEPTQPKSGDGSSQTQPSSGSQPSQGKSYLEQASEFLSGPKKTTLSQVEEVEAGVAAPAEFGLQGIRKIKGPSIEAVSESTAPKMPGYIQIAQQEVEKTQKPKDNVFEYKATPEEQAQIKTDKANRVAYAQEQKKSADANYNALNKDLYDIYEGNDVTGIEAQLNKIETDYKNGAFAGKEDEYYALKTDLFNKRSNSYSQLENKYLDILREDEPQKYQEYVERRAGILEDLNKAGYASWDDYQLKRDLNDQKTGSKRDISSDDSFDIVDKADQKFLRDLRMEAINQVSAPNTTGAGNYIPGLGTGFTSAGTVEKFHKDTQPIMSDYEALMNENAVFERDYQAGKYTPEDANAKYQELKLKEQGLATRLEQAKKESGVTDYDLQRYDLSSRKQGALGATYETGFKDLKSAEDYIRTEQENRQRWVAENPVLGTLTYFVPTVWKEFSNMAVVEGAKVFKPLGETFGAGEGYGWTDALYYGAKDFQESRDALYGYGGQDVNGDGVADDLPGFAKYGQILAQGLGSVGAFIIPGTYANNLFKGTSLGMRSARFATNWAGGFLMMEGPAYDEALRAGLSNEDAARSATLIATLQSAAEQLVPDIKYLEAPVTRAGILSMVKAKVPWDEIMSNGMKYIQDLSISTGKSSFKEAGEEVVGQLATDVGKSISNDAFVRTTHFNMNDPMHPEYSTKPYDNLWEVKNYTDAAIGGALTGGFMTGLKGVTRTYTKNEMEALSYMGKNWKDILANIEKTESNGVSPKDETFKELEKDLKGVSVLYQSLQSMPGFKDLTKANQDMVLSLAFQKKNIQENVRNLGVELPSVKESLAAIDETINAYMTGQLDYGADKPVSYMDDNLAAMGVAFVSVNPDGTYNIEPKKIEGLKPEEVTKKAEEYIKTSLKDNAFADSFLHPKTDRDALSKQETSEIPVQPEAGVGEEVAKGEPKAEPQVTTEEVKQEEVEPTPVVEQTPSPEPTLTTEPSKTKDITPEDNVKDYERLISSGNVEDQNKITELYFNAQNLAEKELEEEAKKTLKGKVFGPTKPSKEAIEKRTQEIAKRLISNATAPSNTSEVLYNVYDVLGGFSQKYGNTKEHANYDNRYSWQSSFSPYSYVGFTKNGNRTLVAVIPNTDTSNVTRPGMATSISILLPNNISAESVAESVISKAKEISNQAKKDGVQVTSKMLIDNILPVVKNEFTKPTESVVKEAPKVEAPVVEMPTTQPSTTTTQEVKPLVIEEEPTVEAPTAETPIAEVPTTETPTAEVKPAAGVRAVKPKVFDSARKNALLAKFKGDSGKRALVSSIDRAATAIRKAYGDVPIYVHETTSDMEAATAITGGESMARTGAGTFQYDDKGNVIAVHVNMEKAGTDTAPHEFTHLILMDAFGDNPELFKEFQGRILKALSASRIKELEAFVNQYTDKDVRPEEFMAQLAGLMTANREKLTPTTAQKIMNLINEFVSRITKGTLIPFTANAQTKSLMDFFNTVSSAMATGQGGENITAAAENVGKAFETDFRFRPRESGAKDGSKEAIVGQVGVETAVDDIAMQDLDVAKDMEAANRAAQDIKAATGWEVGADGQWRYEYPDVELNEDIADDFDVLFYLQENAKREGVRVRPNEMYPPAPLNKILDFGKLEQAYPYISDLAFAVNPNLGGATAVFRPDRNLIEFGPDAIKKEGVEGFNRTLIHEVQHYIQDTEGFEFGTNVSYEADKISKSQDVYKIPGLQLNGAANVGEAVKNGTNEILDMMDNGITVTDIIEGNYDKNKYSGNPEAIVKHTANEGDAESLDEMATTDLEGAKKLVEAAIIKNAIADVAFEQYRATAGEVEARNAEERSRIPYAERLYGKTLESTEDVARRNQVLETAKKAVSAMDVISKKRGVSKAAEIKAQREILGENYDKAKQISDNFEDIAEKLGITKICGL